MTSSSLPRLFPGGHSFFSGWPTICRRANGELIAVASGQRTRHVCPFGRVHLWRSLDDGATWAGPEVLSNGPLDDRDAGVAETATGALVVTWFSSIAYEWILKSKEEAGNGGPSDFTQEESTRWKAVRDGLDDTARFSELGAWAIRSEDGGKSWSKKVSTQVGNPHGPTRLADGRLLMIGNLLMEGAAGHFGSPYRAESGISQSLDDGRSWQLIATPDFSNLYPAEHLHEPHMVQAADGRLVAHYRNHFPERHHHEILQSESFDDGRTWTPLRSLGLIGFPAHLLRLADGRLLSTYSHRDDPRSIRAILSADHGESWGAPITVTEKVWGDFGYPSTVEMGDGDLLSLWYGQVLAPFDVLPGNDWLARLWLQRWKA